MINNFYTIPKFSPLARYFLCLSNEIRGSKFHNVAMIKDPVGIDLEATFSFQKLYAKAICKALEARFDENDIIDVFKVLNLTHMPQRKLV